MSGREETNRAESPPRRQFTCPICKSRVSVSPQEPAARAKFFPFCSERCKLIDLGAWLDADYRIASRPDEEAERPPVEAPPHQDEP